MNNGLSDTLEGRGQRTEEKADKTRTSLLSNSAHERLFGYPNAVNQSTISGFTERIYSIGTNEELHTYIG